MDNFDGAYTTSTRRPCQLRDGVHGILRVEALVPTLHGMKTLRARFEEAKRAKNLWTDEVTRVADVIVRTVGEYADLAAIGIKNPVRFWHLEAREAVTESPRALGEALRFETGLRAVFAIQLELPDERLTGKELVVPIAITSDGSTDGRHELRATHAAIDGREVPLSSGSEPVVNAVFDGGKDSKRPRRILGLEFT